MIDAAQSNQLSFQRFVADLSRALATLPTSVQECANIPARSCVSRRFTLQTRGGALSAK